MKDNEGHNYFFAMPGTPWEKRRMPSILDRLDAIEERLNEIESAIALLKEQEEKDDGEEKEMD